MRADAIARLHPSVDVRAVCVRKCSRGFARAHDACTHLHARARTHNHVHARILRIAGRAHQADRPRGRRRSCRILQGHAPATSVTTNHRARAAQRTRARNTMPPSRSRSSSTPWHAALAEALEQLGLCRRLACVCARVCLRVRAYACACKAAPAEVCERVVPAIGKVPSPVPGHCRM
jgi:hypothetical protein